MEKRQEVANFSLAKQEHVVAKETQSKKVKKAVQLRNSTDATSTPSKPQLLVVWESTIKLLEGIESKTDTKFPALRDRVIASLSQILSQKNLTREVASMIFKDWNKNPLLTEESLNYKLYDFDSALFISTIWTILNNRVRTPVAKTLAKTRYKNVRVKLIPTDIH